MSPFYSTPERCDALTRASWKWLGTPFRANSAVRGPGGGVDCKNLAHAVHLEAGAFTAPLELPTLPMDWHLSHSESGFLEFFQRPEVRARIKHVDREDPIEHGDLIALKVAQSVHHIGTALFSSGELRLLHVARGQTVSLWPLNHPFIRVAAIWRILE